MDELVESSEKTKQTLTNHFMRKQSSPVSLDAPIIKSGSNLRSNPFGRSPLCLDSARQGVKDH